MDAVAGLQRIGELPGASHPVPMGADRQDTVRGAEAAAGDLQHRAVAAMGVHHHQPPHARPRRAGADRGDEREEAFLVQRQRAGEGQVLHRKPHRLMGQHQQRQFRRAMGQRPGQDAGIDGLVGGDGQVRPVLLRGGDGQHRHRVLRQVTEFRPAQLGPETRADRHGGRLPFSPTRQRRKAAPGVAPPFRPEPAPPRSAGPGRAPRRCRHR